MTEQSPDAKARAPRWSRWRSRAKWTVWQAAALSMNLPPAKLGLRQFLKLRARGGQDQPSPSTPAKPWMPELRKRVQTMLASGPEGFGAAADAASGWSYRSAVAPQAVVAWMQRKGWSIPDALQDQALHASPEAPPTADSADGLAQATALRLHGEIIEALLHGSPNDGLPSVIDALEQAGLTLGKRAAGGVLKACPGHANAADDRPLGAQALHSHRTVIAALIARRGGPASSQKHVLQALGADAAPPMVVKGVLQRSADMIPAKHRSKRKRTAAKKPAPASGPKAGKNAGKKAGHKSRQKPGQQHKPK